MESHVILRSLLKFFSLFGFGHFHLVQSFVVFHRHVVNPTKKRWLIPKQKKNKPFFFFFFFFLYINHHRIPVRFSYFLFCPLWFSMCPNLFSWWVPDNNTTPIFFFFSSFLLAYLVDSDRWATTLVYNTQQQQQQMWQHIYKGGSPSYRRGGRIQHRRYRHGSQRVLHVCRMGHFGSARSQV